MKHTWLYISNGDLDIERQQLHDEGKDIAALQGEFAEAARLDLDGDLSLQPLAEELLDRGEELPPRGDYNYREPSDLEGIRAVCSGPSREWDADLGEDRLYDHVLGAWLGRASGCLLGKPVESWRSERMWGYLRDLDRYPLDTYFTADVPEPVAKRYDVRPERAFIDKVDHMPEDDDTNYTVTGLALVRRYGLDFSPQDVADFWLGNLPLLHTCTAERVAYRNFTRLIPPPRSARFRNPYREWIGAQIRADFFGYITPGEPSLAAELAWRDACISHIKNGIYGEMWVAAMLAVAPFTQEIEEIVEAGLNQIPSRSRLYQAVREVMGWREQDLSFEEAVERIHDRWDEHNQHHWCHTISNAEVVTVGLLWSEGDFGRGICRAVQPCFDTDCNGATVGSVLGMMLGARKLPVKWIGPLNDRMSTGVSGYQQVKISRLATETVEIIRGA